MKNDLKYWLALSAIPDVGPFTIRNLLSAFGTPEAIFRAHLKDLVQVEGIGKNRAQQITTFSDWKAVEKTLERIDKSEIKAVRFDDRRFPEQLREIHDAPLILYMMGETREEDIYALAIVGSRMATPYGMNVAERFSNSLASMGFTIVSGMARGIDTAAHRGALRAGGRTIAVLGSGLDVIYPPENLGLAEKIVGSGALITEFPPQTKPKRENFPVRNRLISGLSLGTLVVEASHRSGSLITAQYALDQGREVFAVPGNVMSHNTQGTHGLIQKGAKLVHTIEDIVEELSPQLKGFIRERKKKEVHLNDEEQSVCSVLSLEAKHIDEIVRNLDLALQKVLTILLSLELKGVVKQIDGKRFHLA